MSAARTCLQCGHTWTRRGDVDPQRCPSCASTRWNVQGNGRRSSAPAVTCNQCGHTWHPRKPADQVKACASCGARDWRAPARARRAYTRHK